MLFISESMFEARRRLWDDFKADKFSAKVFFAKMLELDADDYVGLIGAGKAAWEKDDLAGAEEFFWRAIGVNPFGSEPYVALSSLLGPQPESKELAFSLSELGILKRAREREDFLDGIDYQKAGLEGENLETFLGLPAGAKGELVARVLRQARPHEPEDVTERLRPLRLIERMQCELTPSDETIDAIVAEGPAMTPLLLGVVRAWARGYLDKETGEGDLENALALLGETGSPAEIPHLLELVGLDNDVASGASCWALGRIIERNPEESEKFLAGIVPGLGTEARLAVAEQAMNHPEFDPSGKLLARLGENLESVDKERLDTFFPLLLVSMATARGRAGIRLGRTALQRHGGRLSRSARRQCEDLLISFEEAGTPRYPKPRSPRTVYTICAGEVDWAEREEAIQPADEESSSPPPEPVRRKQTPGPNEPCWCNSGKKYKKCHLDSDSRGGAQASGEEKPHFRGPDGWDDLRRRIGDFLGEVLPQREMKQAFREFLGDEPEPGPESKIPLVDWIIHDRFSPTLGETVLEAFLVRRPRLTPREREMVEAWSRSYVGIYEIQQVRTGVGAELKDLIFGETFFVHDVNLSKQLSKWDGLLARIVPGERGIELSGAGFTVPRTVLQPLRAWLDEDRAESGLEWREYLKTKWPRIRRRSKEIGEDWIDSLHLANTDDEELLIAKAVYGILDEEVVIRALRGVAEFKDESDVDDPHPSFAWLNEKNTLLGNIRIDSGQLTLECNSRERLKRGRRLIPSSAALRHLRDEFTTQKELRRMMKEEPPGPKPESDIPVEVRDRLIAQATERHYREWPDAQLPALGGETPRQAVKTAAGRERVIDLLKLIENGEDRKRLAGDPFYDVTVLREDLGLEE